VRTSCSNLILCSLHPTQQAGVWEAFHTAQTCTGKFGCQRHRPSLDKVANRQGNNFFSFFGHSLVPDFYLFEVASQISRPPTWPELGVALVITFLLLGQWKLNWILLGIMIVHVER
jgi:hypothetical protein